MNRAGGFFYHLRALHGRRVRWRPFREAVSAWLARVLPPSPELVLVGPSAGYCLTDEWLAGFERIVVLEPDPFARWMLGRRLRRLEARVTRFVSDDLLVEPLVTDAPALDGMLETMPEAAVLFAGLLGQIYFLTDETRLERFQAAWQRRVLPALERRAWASFHDRFSGSVAPRLTSPYRTGARLTDYAVARFYSPGPGHVALQDHFTEGLFPQALPHAYFHWEIERGVHHLMEGVSHRTRKAATRRSRP
jgi:hypothetical protein